MLLGLRVAGVHSGHMETRSGRVRAASMGPGPPRNLTILDLFLDGLALAVLGAQGVPGELSRDAAGPLAMSKLAGADPVHGTEPS